MITCSALGRYGRFGNALFQIAAVIGIARKSGQPFGFPPFVNWDHKERFGSTEDIELDKYFVNPLPRLADAGVLPFQKKEYPWGYHDIYLPTGSWDLSGHFQSEKYFKHCIDLVRHYFRMTDEFSPQDVCAVHVRLGDYDDNYHTRLTADYYKLAMSLFPVDQKFVIFSDDPVGAFEITKDLRPNGFIYQSMQQGYIDDFKLMKACKHFITGNSSYSLMAAILGDHPEKKIVCPKNWFGPAWTTPMETKDLYPENAIVI